MTEYKTANIAIKREPLHLQVCKAILTHIKDGTWKVGETLPNEYRLSTSFGVSIGTIRTAVDHLVASGILNRKQGRGTWIISDGTTKIHEKFFSFRLGESAEPLDLQFESLSEEVSNAEPYISDLLRLTPDANVHHIVQRAQSPDARILLETYLPESLFKTTEKDELGRRAPALLALQNGLVIGCFEERTTAVLPSSNIANLLSIDEKTPLVKVERRIWDDTGRPIAVRFAIAHLSNSFHYRKEKCEDIKIFI